MISRGFSMRTRLPVLGWLMLLASLLGSQPAIAQTTQSDLPTDVNFDYVVDMADVQLEANSWATYNLARDFDGDARVTVADIVAVARDMGKRASPFGISMSYEFANTALRADVVDAGAGWTRTSMLWNKVEPTDADLTDPSYYGWEQADPLKPDLNFDSNLTAVMNQGLTPIVLLWGTPAWAADPGMPAAFQSCGPFSTTGLTQWDEFVGAFAKRYDGDRDLNDDGIDDIPAGEDPMPDIRYVEVYNEPEYDYEYVTNHALPDDDEGGCWGHDGGAEQYAEVLRHTYLAMIEGNPRIRIVFGAVAYERFTSTTRPTFAVDPQGVDGPFRYDFINRVLQYLWDNYSDDPRFPFFHALSYHNYNDFRNNWDGWLLDGTREYYPAYVSNELIGKANHLRVYKLAPFGLESIPLMCSECSVASGPADDYTDRSDALQSTYPARALVRSMAAGLQVTLWHTLADPGGFEYGLLGPPPTYLTKSAYDTYEVATQYLTGAAFDKLLPISGADGTGSDDIEAYRFTRPDGSKIIVLWTDTDERLGKKINGVPIPDITRNMTFTTSHFGAWTGNLRVIEYDGTATTVSGNNPITITQYPKFVYVTP